MEFLMIVLLIGFMILGFWVSNTLKRRFRTYSQVPTSSGLSGAEVAYQMLSDHGIRDVEIVPTRGTLSDHYNPANRTIALSEEVFYGRHVAAAAVAAHETGHAIQHAERYAPLNMRSALVPIVNRSSAIMNMVLLFSFFGVFVAGFFPYTIALLILVVGQALVTLFTLITLPVEYDASDRALHWLERSRVTQGQEHTMAKSALRWAASTYLVSTLAAVTTLLYYVTLFMGGSRD